MMFKEYMLKFLLNIFNNKLPTQNFYLFKNFNTDELFFIVTIENNDIAIIDIAKKDSLENQLKYLFPLENFKIDNGYKEFNLQEFSKDSIKCAFINNKCEWINLINWDDKRKDE